LESHTGRVVAGRVVRRRVACDFSVWARRWARPPHAFSPGMLLAAVKRKAIAATTQACLSAGLLQASTRETALPHCSCGKRLEKTLTERTHYCPRRGLAGDRDAVSATLAAYHACEDRPGRR